MFLAIFGAHLADVAQLDRAFGYEPKGSRFESWHPQKKKEPSRQERVSFLSLFLQSVLASFVRFLFFGEFYGGSPVIFFGCTAGVPDDDFVPAGILPFV